jgi:uncharacterized membrane protein YidH (DUF202 family)
MCSMSGHGEHPSTENQPSASVENEPSEAGSNGQDDHTEELELLPEEPPDLPDDFIEDLEPPPRVTHRRVVPLSAASRRLETGIGCIGQVGVLILFGSCIVYMALHRNDERVRDLVKSMSSAIHDYGWWGLFALGILLTLVGILRWAKVRRAWRGMRLLPWPTIVFAGLLILAAGALTLWLLLNEAEKASPSDRPNLRIDAIKTTLTVVAGSSGAVALLLTLRRHWTGESDRVTEQFERAVGNLSNENASVRAGALVTLERIANHDISHHFGVGEVVAVHYNSSLGQERHLAWKVLMRLGHDFPEVESPPASGPLHPG